MFAIRYGQSANAQILISKGVSINQKNNAGWTPLMLACLVNDVKIAIELIKNGANINLKNNEGQTAMDIAKTNSPAIYLLLTKLNNLQGAI